MNANATEDTTNRRRYHRFESSLPLEADIEGQARRARPRLLDLGASGCRMIADRPAARGKRIGVRLPGLGPAVLTEGTVVWCTNHQGRSWEIGVRFDPNRPGDADRLYTQVREIETYRQTVADIEGRKLGPADAAREWQDRFGDKVLVL